MQKLGLDVHSANFVLAHVNGRGKFCRQYGRVTTAHDLIDVVGEIRGSKRLVVEESDLAQWVKHVLESYVDELIPRSTNAAKPAAAIRTGRNKAVSFSLTRSA